MVDPSNEEQQCIRILAKLFEEGRGDEISTELLGNEGMNLTDTSFNVMMKKMLHNGSIRLSFKDDQPFSATAHSVEIAREFDAQEKKSKEREDIVEKITFLFTLTITYGDERAKGPGPRSEEQRIHEGRRPIVPLGCGIGGVISRKRGAFVA
jgi:hypothetical protein